MTALELKTARRELGMTIDPSTYPDYGVKFGADAWGFVCIGRQDPVLLRL